MDTDRFGLFTLFVDNLPEDVGINWFRKFFNQYGVVKDAYIPIKRSKITNRRFGFVRYNCATSIEVAISNANGFWIEDRKLFVKVAAFNIHRNKPLQKRVQQDLSNNSVGGKISVVDPVIQNGSNKASFADVVKGKVVSSSVFTIKAKEYSCIVGDDWLSRSVIAKLPSFRSIESIKENFYLECVYDVQIRSLGGNFVVLTFPTLDDLKAMVEGPEVNWLGNFFDEYQQWSPDCAIEASRTVWLDCYGVPLHLWNQDTFFNIGKMWGEPITLDDATLKGSSFSSGKVQIETKVFGVIDQVIKLEINGRLYPIRVIEKQIVVNNLTMAACDCKCKEKESLIKEGEKVDYEDLVGSKDHINEMAAFRDEVNVDSNSLSTSFVGDSLSPSGNGDIRVQNDDCGQVKGVEFKSTMDPLTNEVLDVSHSITSPLSNEQVIEPKRALSKSLAKKRRDGPYTVKERSIHEAILKLERRVRRSNKKISKKKLLSDFGLEVFKKKKSSKEVSTSSLSSFDIRNRNSIFLKNAHMVMDTEMDDDFLANLEEDCFRQEQDMVNIDLQATLEVGRRLGVAFGEKDVHNIKKMIELEAKDLAILQRGSST